MSVSDREPRMTAPALLMVVGLILTLPVLLFATPRPMLACRDAAICPDPMAAPASHVPTYTIFLPAISRPMPQPTATPTMTPTATTTATPEPTPTPSPTVTPVSGEEAAVEAALDVLLNQQRGGSALPPYRSVAELKVAARRHALDMATNDFTSHTGSDGSNAGERMRDAGYNWSRWSEISGWGFNTPDRMMNWWMNSTPHRSAILSSNYDDMGTAYVRAPGSRWTHYWTVNFGRRASVGATAKEDLVTCIYTLSGPLGGSSLIVHSPEPCD